MAFVPFTKDDQPTMAAFNERFQQVIDEAVSRGVKIEVGSYVGTNTYGADNPNSLTFRFKPKLVFVFGRSENIYTSFGVFALDQLTDKYIQGGYFVEVGFNYDSVATKLYAKKVEKTLSWYSTYSSDLQLNGYSDSYTTTYTYFAFG